jgi:alkylation response protein AidB-like acyl-CoA dehydrogenase
VDLALSDSELVFRDELRSWLGANSPGPMPTGYAAQDDWRRDWQRQLDAGGWACVSWPSEFGGRDASLSQSAVFFEELARARAPLPVNIIGLLLGGPTLLVWGSEEQKDRYLRPIASAAEIWCQGFSEPAAGSDLAAVATRAFKRGSDWVLSGQKVWTSNAHFSKWCMVLARTDPESSRHRGLTFFLMDMEQPGVEVRPLRQITGEPEFNELFIEEAVVPDANVVGEVGNGWRVALTTLMNERAGLGFFLQVRMRQLLDELIAEAARAGGVDGALGDRLADLHVRSEIVRLLSWRGLAAIERDGQPGPEGSLVKWLWSETNQLLTETAVELLGTEALLDSSPWAYELLRARGNTIEGGTTEILKTIIAERVLGLPRSR